jgi:glucokinase
MPIHSMLHSAPARLLADVGGTNIRLAIQAAKGASIDHVRVLACADYDSIADAMQAYVQALPPGVVHPSLCAFGIANPFTGDEIRMTNHHWAFSIEALRQRMGFDRLVVVNDFTALALALPDIAPADLRQVGGQQAVAGQPVALIGAGTGLGVSGLLCDRGGRLVPIAGEGGHATLAAETPEEFAVLTQIRLRYGHVSAERVLSGQGLVDLYHAVRTVKGADGQEVSHAADVTRRALGSVPDPLARETLALFCGFLGSVAGNLALTLGATGGVYVGGGIAPRLGEAFAASPFRERFEAKGRFRPYLAAIPVWVIHADVSPALLGAARALDQAI